ncbi:hypothetical protein [Dongia sedimenti]|uniref:Plasmid stabilization protein n=1 Tax=Dongia sedimenti TaxID=3064282 RepID=A0ABU0YUD5_9PROT|nr:hypothetical protein [Rhodospirillaceae bacterium R-7]
MSVRKTRKTASHGEGGESLSASRRHRVDLVMNEARNAGLVGGPKDTVIRGRVSKSLVKAARKRAGVTSDTELLEMALSSFALEDDFGDRFLKRKGSIDPDLPLEF